MFPTLSVCLIVKNEEDRLGRCLSSFRDYGLEIVIVDTGSTDNTKDIARQYDVKLFDCNPETHPQFFLYDDAHTGAPGPYTNDHFLANFAGARNFGWEKATSDYLMWVDADDIVGDAQELSSILTRMEKESIDVAWLPYNYSFNAVGEPDLKQWRERIVRRGLTEWQGMIHETLKIPNSAKRESFTSVVVNHHREAAKPGALVHRNYKVLRKSLEVEGASARTLFYLGNEARWFHVAEAVSYYERYLRVSQWNEERALARIYLGELWETQSYENAFKCYAAATAENMTNPDGWFGMARIAYFQKRWHECIAWSEKGFSLGNPDTALMYNPLDRTARPHVYYNVALYHLGRLEEARESCRKGLLADPNNEYLKNNSTFLANLAKP